MPRLSDLLGTHVLGADERDRGRLRDVVATVTGAEPPVRAIVVSQSGGAIRVPVEAIADVSGGEVRLAEPAGSPFDSDALAWDEVLLRRDVLDAQVFDPAGRSLSRVADLRVELRGGGLCVTDVEIGMGSVLRRLGLRGLARRVRSRVLPWADVHVVSGRAHGLALREGAGGIGRLAPDQVADLIGRLPPPRGAAVLEALPTGEAADVLRRTGPELGAAIVGALDPEGAGRILHEMPTDDATAALRHLGLGARAQVLAAVPSRRAEVLRRLLERRPTTAGGLMNPDVVTHEQGEPAERLLARLRERPPPLDALLTVFAVDRQRRVLGTIPPTRLIAGDLTPVPATTVTAETPLRDVIGRFALEDILALAVTDADGRLLGAVAVDDILEELLAERLPGARRHRIRLGRRR